MEQKLSDTLVKAIDRSNPFMQNLQLASRFNKLVEQSGGESVDLEDNKEISITKNGTIEIAPIEGKDGMKKVTANVNVPTSGGGSWHNINDATISTVNDTLGTTARESGNAIVAFRMKISYSYVTGAIMGGDGDGGATVSACGMKIVDYWDQPTNCFFDTGFDIGYTNQISWNDIATSILNAYNKSTSGSYTFTSFEIYY